MMTELTKKYSSKSSAKKALVRIFKKCGVFHEGGNSADGKFCMGVVSDNGELTLKSNYWVKSSLENFISGKEKL